MFRQNRGSQYEPSRASWFFQEKTRGWRSNEEGKHGSESRWAWFGKSRTPCGSEANWSWKCSGRKKGTRRSVICDGEGGAFGGNEWRGQRARQEAAASHHRSHRGRTAWADGKAAAEPLPGRRLRQSDRPSGSQKAQLRASHPTDPRREVCTPRQGKAQAAPLGGRATDGMAFHVPRDPGPLRQEFTQPSPRHPIGLCPVLVQTLASNGSDITGQERSRIVSKYSSAPQAGRLR